MARGRSTLSASDTTLPTSGRSLSAPPRLVSFAHQHHIIAEIAKYLGTLYLTLKRDGIATLNRCDEYSYCCNTGFRASNPCSPTQTEKEQKLCHWYLDQQRYMRDSWPAPEVIEALSVLEKMCDAALDQYGGSRASSEEEDALDELIYVRRDTENCLGGYFWG